MVCQARLAQLEKGSAACTGKASASIARLERGQTMINRHRAQGCYWGMIISENR
jgi:hypothetical protein